jgi:hypothetical protein
MRRATLAIIAALAMTVTAYSAPKPPNPRADEAINECKRAVVSQAVNPESIDFDKTAWPPSTYGTGAGITVHLYNVRGANAVGGTVRRDWECRVKCGKAKDGADKPCYASSVVEQAPMLPEVLKVNPATQGDAKK